MLMPAKIAVATPQSRICTNMIRSGPRRTRRRWADVGTASRSSQVRIPSGPPSSIQRPQTAPTATPTALAVRIAARVRARTRGASTRPGVSGSPISQGCEAQLSSADLRRGAIVRPAEPNLVAVRVAIDRLARPAGVGLPLGRLDAPRGYAGDESVEVVDEDRLQGAAGAAGVLVDV